MGDEDEGEKKDDQPEKNTKKKKVTEMGTYVTQSAFTAGNNKNTPNSATKRPPPRQFFIDGDFSLSGPLCTALTKQGLRFNDTSASDTDKNQFVAKCMRILASVYNLGEYCEQPEEITNFMKAIEKSVGDLPIVKKELKLAAGDVDEDEGEKKDDQPEKNTKK